MESLSSRPEAGEQALGAIVDIVIVNWNSQSLLRECLTALDQSDIAERLNIIVVDNASTDGSAEGLALERARFDLALNGENCGFAVACNQGAKRGAAQFLLFLNPDVRVKRDAVASVARYLNEPAHSGVGILGIQLLDSEGHIQRSCARAPSAATLLLRSLFLDQLLPALVPPHFLIEWDHDDTRPVDQVMGAFLLIRRDLFKRLGEFDERFFLYYEDVDLCVAARQAGWSVVHHAGAQAVHVGQGTTSAVKDRRLFYHANSRVEYCAKRHGRTAAIVLVILLLWVEMPIRWFHATIARSPREGWLVIRGMALFWRNLPKLLTSLVRTG